MTRSEKLRDLAARVDALTAPDFALGVEVLRAFGRDIGDVNPLFSLDAAASLMPAGWDWAVTKGFGEDALAAASPANSVATIETQATTPALALTAAALRALAQEAGDE
jgi:hypothetical protein